MSDFGDDYDDDDFEFGDYFYIEDSEDFVGDLAEHAVASPQPYDDGTMDDEYWEWDRFAYWNDIEYDSDGYHDVDTDQTAAKRRKRKGAPPPPKGKLKRRLDEVTGGSPAKRRKAGKAGTSHPIERHEAPEIGVTPIEWKDGDECERTPMRKGSEEPFALLKHWRDTFPEKDRVPRPGHEVHDDEGEDEYGEEDEEDAPPVEIGQEAILAALRANLGKLTGGAEGSGGADEALLMQHITAMLGQEGASLDAIAGDLADALFAPDDESVASDALQEKKGDGDFGQWVLNQAGGGTAVPDGARQASGNGELSPPPELADELPALKDVETPTQRRPPTPTSAGSSSGSHQQTGARATQVIVAAATASEVKSRKRKPGDEEDDALEQPAKRSTTRSFDAPTASSRAKSAQIGDGKRDKPPSKMEKRKASKMAARK